MSTSTGQGYDSAQAHRDGDDLDRWRLAAEIVEVVLATPSDWSARLGILGKWGEGKTTVLQFAERMLKESGSIVFTFSPWAIQSWNDLWENFGDHLSEALSAASVPIDSSWKRVLRDSRKWLRSTGADHAAEAAAAMLGREKVYTAAFGAVGQWLKYDGAQIRAIREKLKEQRLVVLIDDLDRCSPELIPQLLLSLRELLDLPGFTFLLAFDDEIVGRALTQKNPAWAEGSNFLEKILDFRFYLPPITQLQKERLINRAIEKYCPFVPLESTAKIQDLLPNNPRKLKSLIRSLAALRPQLTRHDPDELNWVDMWLAQMLRLESYRFFERLLSDKTLEEEAGFLYSTRRSLLRNRKGGENEDSNQTLKRLIKDAGIEDAVLVQRLVQLTEACRSRSSFHFRYMCELAIRPHAVTWKEFRVLRTTWERDRRPAVLSSWISQHASDRGVSADDVEAETYDAILTKKGELLSLAAESKSVQEHESSVGLARTLLEMAGQYLLDLGKLTAPRFRKLYDQAVHWIGFRKNPADKMLREREEALLLNLVSSASEAMSLDLLELVLPEGWDLDMGDGTLSLKQALREKCQAVLAPKAAKEALSFITREGGIRSLTEPGRFPAVKYCLFNPQSLIWTTKLRDELLRTIMQGQGDNVIYSNVCDFFEVLIRGLEQGFDTVSSQAISELLSNEEFAHSLWKTVTSREIQYRMQIAFIRARESLVRNGIPEASLQLTKELRQRLEEESRANTSGGASGETRALVPGQMSQVS